MDKEGGPLAEKGYVSAHFNFGLMYYYGTGILKDKALSKYQIASLIFCSVLSSVLMQHGISSLSKDLCKGAGTKSWNKLY